LKALKELGMKKRDEKVLCGVEFVGKRKTSFDVDDRVG